LSIVEPYIDKISSFENELCEDELEKQSLYVIEPNIDVNSSVIGITCLEFPEAKLDIQ